MAPVSGCGNGEVLRSVDIYSELTRLVAVEYFVTFSFGES
jgi:hypothetical protein